MYMRNSVLPVLFILIAGALWVAATNRMELQEPLPDQTPVSLYYYDPALDLDSAGNVMCSRAGVTPVPRMITSSDRDIEDTIRLLLRGELSESERARGLTTEFPLDGVTLENAELINGKLTLTFADPLGKTSGGACRAGVLLAQIEATALSFEEVKEVRFMPPELFQP